MRPLLEQESVYFFYSGSRFVDNFYTIVQKLSFGRIYSSGQALVQALDAEGRAVVRIGASRRGGKYYVFARLSAGTGVRKR